MHKKTLNVIICGGAGEEKSTLIDHLPRDSNIIFDVQSETPEKDAAQFTRDMAAAASTADLAIIQVDARKGLLTPTRQRSRIVHS